MPWRQLYFNAQHILETVELMEMSARNRRVAGLSLLEARRLWRLAVADLVSLFVGHHTSDHFAGIEIDDNGQIRKSFQGSDIGDIGHPSLIRCRHIELPIQRVIDHKGWFAAIRAGAAFVTDLSPYSCHPRQSGDTIRTNPKGRPKGTRNFKTDLEDVLQQRVTLREGDRERKVSTQHAIVRAAAAKALKGDTRAIHMIAEWVLALIPDDAELDPIERVSSADLRMIEGIIGSLSPQLPVRKVRPPPKPRKSEA